MIRSETDLGVFTVIWLVNIIGIIIFHVAYHRKYEEINDFMDFFAETELPLVPEEDGKKLKQKTYIGIGKRYFKLIAMAVGMGYFSYVGYWPNLKSFANLEDDALYKWTVGFCLFLSFYSTLAAPVHLGTYIDKFTIHDASI